jgi:hypothetical protein
MVPAKRTQSSPALKHVQELFERWRRQKKRRDPIPQALWNAAVSLTDRYSVHRISRQLRLNFNDLKARARDRPPAFIELTLAGPGHAGCTVEMAKPTGERMRIEGACDVVGLAREFWKA